MQQLARSARPGDSRQSRSRRPLPLPGLGDPDDLARPPCVSDLLRRGGRGRRPRPTARSLSLSRNCAFPKSPPRPEPRADVANRQQARYVHQDCLRSWREADKLNSFYQCGQCGARYRFRQTSLTKLLGRRRASHSLCPPRQRRTLMEDPRRDDLLPRHPHHALDVLHCRLPRRPGHASRRRRRARRPNGPALLCVLVSLALALTGSVTDSSTPAVHYYDDPYALGDALRETTSTTGYLLGDCTWSSPRELVRSHMRSTFFKGDIKHVKESIHESRARSTGCGDRWAVRDEGQKWGQDDRARREDWAARAVLHMVKGATTAAWGWAFACRTRAFSLSPTRPRPHGPARPRDRSGSRSIIARSAPRRRLLRLRALHALDLGARSNRARLSRHRLVPRASPSRAFLPHESRT